MGFLGLPSKKDLIKRVVVEVIDGVNDQLDTEEEREDIADWLNDHVNLPILDEAEEKELFLNAVEALHKALEGIEAIARKTKF